MNAQQIAFLELLNGKYQYVVPRWQRRYRWGESEIRRLVDDLVAVAKAEPSAGHYGGTLLTFPEPGLTPGMVTTIRVVDGQQRLTTVSILLACIAERLGPEGSCDGWTAKAIRADRLTNPGESQQERKLRLQDGDEEEYCDLLAGRVGGAGAVTQAWRTLRRLVREHDLSDLLRGLARLRVVSIGLDTHEDPQQIFESLNATGRPLAESEKVKNWLLMGLPDTEQQRLHDDYWREIERQLAATNTTAPVDEFLRDVLRWWTGRLQGIDAVYDELRRWTVHRGRLDRPQLCQDLAGLSKHYGLLTGTAGQHSDARVERHLRHLRALGIHVHRPLTMRLLHDADAGHADSSDDLADTVGRVASWVTRLWLAGRPTAGLNKAVAELAYGPGPSDGEGFADHWRFRIDGLRLGRAGVPDNEAIREGVRTRRGYGGSATHAAFAVFCAIMEEEQPDESPARDRLTIEHVMPQKLTTEWRDELGENANAIHAAYRDRLANLTLSGDATNSSLGAKSFAAKKQAYGKSGVGLTREIASETTWNEETLDRRAERLADKVLQIWPWETPQTTVAETGLRWRLDGGEWHAEEAASTMVLRVAAALLARDSANLERLRGSTLTRDLQLASQVATDARGHTKGFQAVPGHADLVLYPYARDYSTSADRCRQMGKRCGVSVEVELRGGGVAKAFWRLLWEETGGLPGQKDNWRGNSQWTTPLNPAGDRVGIYVGNPDLLWLYIYSGNREPAVRAARMLRYSAKIREVMADQQIGDRPGRDAAQGWSVSIQRPWVRDDESEWPAAALWIKEQQGRLAAILQADEE